LQHGQTERERNTLLAMRRQTRKTGLSQDSLQPINFTYIDVTVHA
jgi:hypothetical protein